MKDKQTQFLKQVLTEDEYESILKDSSLFKQSKELYSDELIDSVNIISIDDKRFLIRKEDANRMPNNFIQTLSIVEVDNNPIYVEVSEEGVLLID